MFEDHIYKVDRKRNSLSIVDLLRVSFASLVFPRASRQSAPARQQNGKTYWQVKEKIKDNIKTMPRHWPVLRAEAPIWAGLKGNMLRKRECNIVHGTLCTT